MPQLGGRQWITRQHACPPFKRNRRCLSRRGDLARCVRVRLRGRKEERWESKNTNKPIRRQHRNASCLSEGGRTGKTKQVREGHWPLVPFSPPLPSRAVCAHTGASRRGRGEEKQNRHAKLDINALAESTPPCRYTCTRASTHGEAVRRAQPPRTTNQRTQLGSPNDLMGGRRCPRKHTRTQTHAHTRKGGERGKARVKRN